MIIYQIFPDRFFRGSAKKASHHLREWGEAPSRTSFFGGDLNGITQKMDYIQSTGAEAIYLTPIFDSPSTHKYDTADYFKIDEGFGTSGDLDSLITAAHNRGIKVFIDGVFNHTGLYFFAFRDIRNKGRASRYYHWYNIYSTPLTTTPKPSYEDAGIYYIPKLNHDNPEVVDYLCSVIQFWSEKGIDGWRFDMPWCIKADVVNRLIDCGREINPGLIFIGEAWGYPDEILNRCHFDGAMDYTVRDSLIGLLTGKETIQQFIDKLHHKTSGKRDRNWNMLSSHDTPRIRGVLRNNIGKVLTAQAVQFFLPGDPVIYYGDEIGLFGGKDPDCRRTFNWNKREWNDVIYRNILELSELRRSRPLYFLNGSCAMEQKNDKLIIRRILKNKNISLYIDLIKNTYSILNDA